MEKLFFFHIILAQVETFLTNKTDFSKAKIPSTPRLYLQSLCDLAGI